jgi:hypothetical protein
MLLGATSLPTRLFGATRKPVNDSGFSFPKHKEFLTEDFFNDYDEKEYREDKNPYGTQGEVDYEDWKRPVHKKTKTGILSTYKK